MELVILDQWFDVETNRRGVGAYRSYTNAKGACLFWEGVLTDREEHIDRACDGGYREVRQEVPPVLPFSQY
jgi:hypothetical protein